MIKISRIVGMALAITGLMIFCTLAIGICQIKFEDLNPEIRTGIEPVKEIGPILFNEKLADEFIQFQYQFLLAEYYSHSEDYATAHIHYEKAIQSAKASLGEKSFFTHIAYFNEAMTEEKNDQSMESREHFKAALRALPNNRMYGGIRWINQLWLISVLDDQTNPDNIPFYREHLALTQKLLGPIAQRTNLVDALSLLANSLDNTEKKDESELVWRRMVDEARGEDCPKQDLVTALLDFAFHENHIGNASGADKALVEAAAVAEQTNENELRGKVLQRKASMCLDSQQLDGAHEVYKQYLALAEKTENKKMLSTAYEWLGEIERRRGNFKKREEYLDKALKFARRPWEKYGFLAKLAVLARINGKTEIARNYVKQWKSLPERALAQVYIGKTELDAVLLLYPKLAIGKLERCNSNIPRFEGYDISTEQLDMLMNAI